MYDWYNNTLTSNHGDSAAQNNVAMLISIKFYLLFFLFYTIYSYNMTRRKISVTEFVVGVG